MTPRRYNPWTALALVVYHGLAIAALFLPMPPAHLAAAALVYLGVGLGTTLGLHRRLSHGAFSCPRWLEYGLVTLAMLTLQSNPLEWVANHRLHHARTETDQDPHTPRKGFWYSHLGWVIDDAATDRLAYEVWCRDLAADPYYQWLRRYRWVPHLIAVGGVGLTAGWAAVPLILYLPMKAWMHSAYMVNSVCHTPWLGRRAHDTADDSRNVAWVGLVGLGEGWHNNHHARPGSAWFGHGWREPDIGGWVLRGLARLGLARIRSERAARAG